MKTWALTVGVRGDTFGKKLTARGSREMRAALAELPQHVRQTVARFLNGRAPEVVFSAVVEMAPNPPELLTFGPNPGKRTKGARLLGHLHKLQYMHETEGPREHDFGGHEVIELLPDGSVRIYDPRGESLWADL